MDPVTALFTGIFGGATSANPADHRPRHASHAPRHGTHRTLAQEEYSSWFPASYGSEHHRSGRHGMASWYGNELRGHRTASGERFNPGGLTAAHRTLPMGTHVRVWHGSRSIVVRINDRGPFVRGRVLDLSRAAAASLGCSGTCSISYEVL